MKIYLYLIFKFELRRLHETLPLLNCTSSSENTCHTFHHQLRLPERQYNALNRVVLCCYSHFDLPIVFGFRCLTKSGRRDSVCLVSLNRLSIQKCWCWKEMDYSLFLFYVNPQEGPSYSLFWKDNIKNKYQELAFILPPTTGIRAAIV